MTMARRGRLDSASRWQTDSGSATVRLMRLPLNEFDDDDAIVRPSPVRVNGRFPPFAVLCFFPEAIDQMQRDGELKRIGEFSAQLGGMAI